MAGLVIPIPDQVPPVCNEVIGTAGSVKQNGPAGLIVASASAKTCIVVVCTSPHEPVSV